jgi:hypothetical protein
VKPVVAAAGALVGGLVVVQGVRPAVAAAGAAVGAGAAAAGVRRRPARAGALALAAGLLLALALPVGPLAVAALLLLGALADAVGGLLASKARTG